ncbi:MAG TPA: alpha-L-fucosidase [Limnochordia bacterium]|nr:alpha-L-fucosidase [Limnochordia bacterium]
MREYRANFARDPRAAATAWFQDARFGLFLHYGLYSLLGRGEWVMFHERIPVAQYETLIRDFTASGFDADAICALTRDAGMHYITITARHHDSFCLWATAQTEFNSVHAPAGRDLISELARACRKYELGLFLYYSYALDWRHPYFFSLEAEGGLGFARPAYTQPEPTYRYRTEADFVHYRQFVHAQLRELLTQYGPLAGLWLDPILPYYDRADLVPIEETYALIRSLQPHCLIAFKQGANGDEDFASPEHTAATLADRLRKRQAPPAAIARAEAAWARNQGKWNEICTTLQPRGWGYVAASDAARHSADDVMQMLQKAADARCNLLLNSGPLPDGSIHPTDRATLLEVGRRLRTQGLPKVPESR